MRIGISALADMCGYADGSSLRRAFLAKTGCSMSEWRRNARTDA
jgi:AraC-like DNA-binding protein